MTKLVVTEILSSLVDSATFADNPYYQLSSVLNC